MTNQPLSTKTRMRGNFLEIDMKKIMIIVICAAVLGIAAWMLFKNESDEPKFKTEKIMRGHIIETVTASGTVNPVTTVLVGTQVSGTVKNIYAYFFSYKYYLFVTQITVSH